MRNKIPFSLVPFKQLKKISKIFLGLGNKIEKNLPFIRLSLEQSRIDAKPDEYAAMSIMASIIFFVFSNIFFSFILFLFKFQSFILFSLTISLMLTLFVFLQQLFYPKIQIQKRAKDLERNLLPALEDALLQLNSGISLFRVIVNISRKNYGEVSKEFASAVNKINAGVPQIEVLDELASKSLSLYFRRAIWQLVNGMKTGADIGAVLKEVISALSEAQLIQIQRYSGQLNPLVMFYMIIAIILPSLGMTFLMVISSFIAANEIFIKIIFWGFYGAILFFQIMFLGLIKTKRPSLLER